MKVELENILDIGTTLYSLDENFKIKRKVVVNIQSVFEQNVSHSPEIHTTYKVSNTRSKPKYDLEFKDFFIPLQDCIERDSKRPNPIGEEVIRKTYEKYKDILKV